MKKTIILSGGVKKEMTFEEVLKQFKPMMNKHVNIAMSKFENQIEREDMIQEMSIELMRAFENYDGEHAFSTYLTYKLQRATGNFAQKTTAKKRSGYGLMSMNSTLGDSEDLTLEDMIPSHEEGYGNMISNGMMELIMNNLNDREKDELKCILYPIDFPASKLAQIYGISRQACNQRVNKTKMKLQNLLLANNYA